MSTAYFADESVALDEWDTNTGRPGISLVANAIQFWAIQQKKPPTVREAALTFNCDDQMIRQAVEFHYWMFVTGPDDDPSKQIIEHEGE